MLFKASILLILLAFVKTAHLSSTKDYPNVQCLVKRYVYNLECPTPLDVKEMCNETEVMLKADFEDARIFGARVAAMLCDGQDSDEVFKTLECTQEGKNRKEFVNKCGRMNLRSTDCGKFAEQASCAIDVLNCGNEKVVKFLTEAFINDDDHRDLFNCREEIAKEIGIQVW
ncbi:unnamed protein product, partial [Mesorhabditis belari]|uniref:DUF19 domain-containing protein n=1 Tax=Mesorhabditis belari TaxID=2138241 RepID=A0AAF3FAM8_9BILA